MEELALIACLAAVALAQALAEGAAALAGAVVGGIWAYRIRRRARAECRDDP